MSACGTLDNPHLVVGVVLLVSTSQSLSFLYERLFLLLTQDPATEYHRQEVAEKGQTGTGAPGKGGGLQREWGAAAPPKVKFKKKKICRHDIKYFT